VIGASARNEDIRHEAPRQAPVVDLERAKRFYARQPVILFSGHLSDVAKSVAGDTYQFLEIKCVAEDHLLLRDLAGQDRRLSEPPLHLAGIVTFEKADADLLARAADWLRLRRPDGVPEPQLFETDDIAAFAAGLLATQYRSQRQQSEMNTALSRQLADLRQGNEDLQNRFAALEAFIGRHGLQPFERAFVNDPILDDTDPTAMAPNVLAMATNARVSQILPVASLGVSAIALHIARAAPRSEATLSITLNSIESGEQIESWTIPAADIPQGWMTLSLRTAVAGLKRTLRLVISAEGARSDLPILSLGGAQPLDLFRLQDCDLKQSVTASSLALQIYVGLPGVVPPSPGGFAAQHGHEASGGGLRELSLSSEILREITQVHLDPDASGFNGVTYLDGERIISCHPPAFGMTIAKLPAGCPAGTLRLSANLLVDNAQSRDVEFALVASNDETRIMHLLGGVAEPVKGEGFSGWIRVPAKQPRFASLYIEGNAPTAGDLYLATRMVEPGNHDFAWARFLNLHALVQG
jgi:hypothetical protein